jgi:hypothetical protein
MPPATDYHEAAKTFRHAMINEYDALRRRLETPEYFAGYVLSKYLYKGADLEARARQALRNLGNVDYLHNGDSPKEFEIPDCGIGIYSLLYALMHPETEVYASDTSEENLAIASHCSSLPKNLHYEPAQPR